MPPQIGNVISELVYETKLKSNPSHPVTENITACYFVEAPGKEKALASSYMVFNYFLVFLNDGAYLFLSLE